jgi:DNA-binding CsgD family transcriptional regulator
MRDNPGPYRQLPVSALVIELARGALSAIVLVALAVAGLTLWVAIPLALLMYVGLWWIEPRVLQRAEIAQPISLPEDTVNCLMLQQQIHEGIGQVEHPQTAESFRSNICWIDKSLEAIAEDGKHEFSTPLLALTSSTNKLLVDYLKVVRRGFDDAEIRERVQRNLETLDIQYEQLWNLLNLDTIEHLKELSDSIDKARKKLDEQPDPPGLPADPSESLEESVPPEAAKVRLTPSELEVVKLVAKGFTDREIGEERFIAKTTASDHVSNSLRKVGVSTRAELAAWAVRNGLA